MKRIIYLLLTLLLFNCGYPFTGLKTHTLKNGYTKAASNPKVYANKSKFQTSILKKIDTTVIYEKFEKSIYKNMTKIIINKPARENHRNNYKNYGVYRFYNNGNFNYFILSTDNDTLKKELFNPIFTGWRGVYYKDKSIIKGDLITKVSGEGAIGILNKTFEFKGDSLIVTSKNKKEIYLKRKIPFEYLNHISNW